MDFEQAMKRLTEISELMGKSDLKLEDSEVRIWIRKQSGNSSAITRK